MFYAHHKFKGYKRIHLGYNKNAEFFFKLFLNIYYFEKFDSIVKKVDSEVFYFSVPKSKKGNEIWTFLKMSKNENPKKVLKNSFEKVTCDHNAFKNKF